MKRNYINPEVLVSCIGTMSIICVSGGSGSGQLNNIPTDDQW